MTSPGPAESVVVSVARSDEHRFSKAPVDAIDLVAGLGVDGDAHQGALVRHRSRVAADPNQPNLRQVHLLPVELLDAVAALGFAVEPGDLGENVLTRGLDLVSLPTGTVLRLGDTALVALTGLRNPCGQIDGFSEGLLDALVVDGADGRRVRRAGVMGVVLLGGRVRSGDPVEVALPPGPAVPMVRV